MQSSPPDVQEVKPRHGGLLRRLIPSLLLAGFLSYLFSTPSAGIGVFYIIIPQTILIPMRLFKAINVPGEARLHLARVVIWLVSIGTIFSVHAVREDIYRKEAEGIVARIDAYSTSRGKCPANIEDVGISRAELKDQLGSHAYYTCENGKPYFMYGASFMIYSSWRYDFQHHTWSSHSSG